MPYLLPGSAGGGGGRGALLELTNKELGDLICSELQSWPHLLEKFRFPFAERTLNRGGS